MLQKPSAKELMKIVAVAGLAQKAQQAYEEEALIAKRCYEEAVKKARQAEESQKALEKKCVELERLPFKFRSLPPSRILL